MNVILDNGHGCDTPGKRSPVWSDGVQLFEWKYNRDLVKAIHEKLNNLGIKSTILVPEDESISLSTRLSRVNQLCNEDQCILISVHCNAGKGTGWECWTTCMNNESDVLAGYFLNTYTKYFNRRCRGAKEKNFTILLGGCPSILTENFFMDNEEECRWMLEPDTMNKIVDFHVESIKEYLRCRY